MVVGMKLLTGGRVLLPSVTWYPGHCLALLPSCFHSLPMPWRISPHMSALPTAVTLPLVPIPTRTSALPPSSIPSWPIRPSNPVDPLVPVVPVVVVPVVVVPVVLFEFVWVTADSL